MANTTTYITKQGDTWDSVAWEVYGDPFKIKLLTDANPNINLVTEFNQGEILFVPLLTVEEEQDDDLLPPWKR